MSAIDQSRLRREPFTAFWANVRGDWTVIDMPVLTEVIPGLWVGGEPEPRLPSGFDFVVNLYAPWARYEHDGTDVWDVAVNDDEVGDDEAALFVEVAREVNRRVDDGQTVLVHCQAGLNRSVTVVALVLMLRGMKAADAIALLREKRHRLVLCNPHFEKWLLGLPATSDGERDE